MVRSIIFIVITSIILVIIIIIIILIILLKNKGVNYTFLSCQSYFLAELLI